MDLNFELKKLEDGFDYVIGCDEVGRGCLAGPVVAAAAVFDFEKFDVNHHEWAREVRDSKLLSPKKREELSGFIKSYSLGYGIGIVEPEMIDEINIHQASLLAMRRAVENIFVSDETPGVIPSDQIFFSVSKNIWEPRNLLKNQVLKDKGFLHAPSISTVGGNVGLGRDDNSNILLAVDGKFCIPEFNMKQEVIVDGDAKIFSIAAASIVAKVFRDSLMSELHKKYPAYNFAQHKGYATKFHREAILKNGLSPLHRKTFCKQLVK